MVLLRGTVSAGTLGLQPAGLWGHLGVVWRLPGGARLEARGAPYGWHCAIPRDGAVVGGVAVHDVRQERGWEPFVSGIRAAVLWA